MFFFMEMILKLDKIAYKLDGSKKNLCLSVI